MAKATLYVIRHGKTELNHSRRLQGRSDFPLSAEGIAEAERAAKWFRAERIRFDRVWSSPLIRAVRTAEIVAKGAAIRTDDRLLEMDYGPYEGIDLTDPPPEITSFFRDFTGTPAPPGMEPLASVKKRAGLFLEELKTEELSGNVLISTHAIAMKGILEYLTPESGGGYWGRYVGNCDVFRTELVRGGYTVPVPVYEYRG